MYKGKDHLQWFEEFRGSLQYERLTRRPIAYFCAEYGIDPKVPTYAGGLGILAGDMVREAGDQRVPLIAVGLYYYEGYLCDSPDEHGKALDTCEVTRPQDVGLTLVQDEKGERLTVKVPIHDHDVVVQAWKWQEEDNVAYFLDTNIEENQSNDRMITNRLYVGDKETRLKQQLVLGIGGLRLLEALGEHPQIYHMNEGHSAFLAMELTYHQMKERELSFDEAKQFARRRMVMTNHTLVAAGNELYSNDLVALMLTKYAEDLQVPVDELVRMGLVQESSTFSMTMLALRMAGVVNAVSTLHAKKAREIWADHPMVGVTNGVHVPTWDQIHMDISAPGGFWKAHQEHKAELIEHINGQAGTDWSKDDLLIGWARRFVKYKRPLSAIEDARRFAEIAKNSKRPIRLVYAGIPHPSDENGLKMLSTLKDLTEGELKGLVAYLPGYGIELAKKLLSGTDLWLNTPVVGFEACGTSGMKAALNGSLPFSTNDGWVFEAELYKVGWLLDGVKVTEDFLDKIEKEIAPMYYDRNSEGVPELWEEHMRNARDMALEEFSATRMLRQYIQKMYL